MKMLASDYEQITLYLAEGKIVYPMYSCEPPIYVCRGGRPRPSLF